jgi:XTP/dITP diphosphohydrolase
MGRITAVFASGNAHKLRELRALLPSWEIELLDATDMPEETGESFYDNAAAKARFARAHVAPVRWALGEDSGLEVAGLDGAPGIRSARYAGPGASDADNVAKLLAELAGTEGDGRRARYVSELIAVSPEGAEIRGTGFLEGTIALEPRGSAGFGYDPVFVPDGHSATVAELGDGWKRLHSHRSASARVLTAEVGEQAEEM